MHPWQTLWAALAAATAAGLASPDYRVREAAQSRLEACLPLSWPLAERVRRSGAPEATARAGRVCELGRRRAEDAAAWALLYAYRPGGWGQQYLPRYVLDGDRWRTIDWAWLESPGVRAALARRLAADGLPVTVCVDAAPEEPECLLAVERARGVLVDRGRLK